MAEKEKILMIGAGRWGSAVAVYLQRLGYEVGILCHSSSTKEAIIKNGASPYLPEFLFQSGLQCFTTWDPSTFAPTLLILSTPSPFVRSTLAVLPLFDKALPILGINKGVTLDGLKTIPELIAEAFPDNPYLHLGGPCFPSGLLLPGAVAAETLAGKDSILVETWQAKLASKNFRLYASDDVFGVAFLGALKNIFALASGVLLAAKANEEAFAILVTRGIYEIQKVALAHGAKESTVYGLSGLGDLILTCYSSSNSHNRNFGRRVVETGSVDKVLTEFGHAVAEGYTTTKAVYQLNQQQQIDSPIINAVYAFLYEQIALSELLQKLMQRPLKKEAP